MAVVRRNHLAVSLYSIYQSPHDQFYFSVLHVFVAIIDDGCRTEPSNRTRGKTKFETLLQQ